MKKIYYVLFAVLVALMPLAAQAMPFVPTTNPLLSSTYWYQLRTGSIYLSASNDSWPDLVVSSSAETTDNYLWCFVGNETTGYKVYNKAAQRYLVTTQFDTNPNDPNVVTCEETGNNTFYLVYHMSGAGFYDKYYYRYYASQQMIIGDVTNPSAFSVVEVIKGTEESKWTRYDIDGVGYTFLSGGTSAVEAERSNNLCDNDATTKYYGSYLSCWVEMEASQPVVVRSYSLVTANDTHEYYSRIPQCWRLQGSNDKTNWTDIDVQTDYPVPFADQQEVIINVHSNNPVAYRYFKLRVTDAASNYVQLSEVWINPQNHTWQEIESLSPTCGKAGYQKMRCSDCHAITTSVIAATQNHTFAESSDACSVCGTKKGVTVLLPDGQTYGYLARALHGYRNTNQTWPSLPEGWSKANYNDNSWIPVSMPIASLNHSGGPYKGLMYNSNWYGEYNYYLIRRVFNLPSIIPNAVFKLRCVHDDNLQVFVNGYSALVAEGWTSTGNDCTFENSAEEFILDSKNFQVGTNVLGIWIQQNYGGAYFDCSLTMEQQSQNLKGDVTGEGKVDVADINLLVNMILGNSEKTSAGDVDSDGKVDIADLNSIINIILGTE